MLQEALIKRKNNCVHLLASIDRLFAIASRTMKEEKLTHSHDAYTLQLFTLLVDGLPPMTRGRMEIYEDSTHKHVVSSPPHIDDHGMIETVHSMIPWEDQIILISEETTYGLDSLDGYHVVLMERTNFIICNSRPVIGTANHNLIGATMGHEREFQHGNYLGTAAHDDLHKDKMRMYDGTSNFLFDDSSIPSLSHEMAAITHNGDSSLRSSIDANISHIRSDFLYSRMDDVEKTQDM